jgi:hypothetical protein
MHHASVVGLLVSLLNAAGSPLPPPDLKIAFTGDTDSTDEGKQVLQLVKTQGAHALLVAGDLDYQSGSRAANWEGQIDEVLGADFPVFPVRGNHDGSWTQRNSYRDRLTRRWNRLQEMGVLTWSGAPGMKSTVTFKGVSIVAVAPSNGVSHADSAAYIQSSFAADRALWRVSIWHENMPPYRGNAGCGSDGDLVGWEVYEASRRAGAFIVNGHNHAFGRTKLLSCTGGPCSTASDSRCEDAPELPTVANVPDPVGSLTLAAGEAGTNFVMLVGLGGHDTGRIKQTGPWWAKQGGNSCQVSGAPCAVSGPGAMFCTFNPGGTNPRKALCQFRDVEGRIIDSFEMTSGINL